VKVRILRLRRPLTVLLHLLLVVVSNWLAFILRFDGRFPAEHVEPFWNALPWLIVIRGLTFWPFRLYHGLWRYVSVWDLQNIILAVGASTVVFGVLVLGPLDLRPYPRGVLVVDSVVLIVLLGGVRLGRRLYREFDRLQSEKRVLIFGAGDAGEMLVRDMRHNPFYNLDPVAFIDDDPAKVGQRIHGVPVLGTRSDLAKIINREQPHEVVVAIPIATPAQIRSIVKSLEPFRMPIKILPNLRDVLAGKVEVGQVRNLSLEDLMSRPPVDLDAEPVRRLVNGRRVLVTGAGGSIGSELSRQIAGFGPARLIVLDRYENTLFELCGDLAAHNPSCSVAPVIADIADAVRIDRVFAEFQPELVFHAAAHKHVPLMEANPCEAVKNNVRGTRILAETAARYQTSSFVLISSDKAVNPSSVMGATKRVGEHLIRTIREPRTRFMAVRFGNVLGSNGSVTRIFASQIARGGPVTVTHPEIRRYFMLIPEAVQLVLHTAAMSGTGTIYALEMGEQVRMQDLARNMIRLSGFVPDEEIQIQYIGLRPGEKLYEELVEDGETTDASQIPKIMRVRPTAIPADRLWARLPQLEAAAEEGRDRLVVELLGDLVPTFRHREAPEETRAASVVPLRRPSEGVGSVGT
jgi:FlaA1/EpsC-like NDP-sugar epimerase